MISVLLALSLVGLAQTSSDRSFSVRHSNNASYSLSAAQMRDAESIYHNACEVVQRHFQSAAGELRPHFTVIIGADRNQVYEDHSRTRVGDEIRMKQWNPRVFAEAVVVLAFDQMMRDAMRQLGERALRQSNAAVDVARLK